MIGIAQLKGLGRAGLKVGSFMGKSALNVGKAAKGKIPLGKKKVGKVEDDEALELADSMELPVEVVAAMAAAEQAVVGREGAGSGRQGGCRQW